MQNETREQNLIKKRFNIFKSKLVDENPEYRKSFDKIISDAYDNNSLWDLLENADKNLKSIIKKKAGINNLIISDYYKALCI
jgi:hypothetical protein